MKIRLLNDGGYIGMERVGFPVEVEAARSTYGVVNGFDVPDAELRRIGADLTKFKKPEGSTWFFLEEETEVLS